MSQENPYVLEKYKKELQKSEEENKKEVKEKKLVSDDDKRVLKSYKRIWEKIEEDAMRPTMHAKDPLVIINVDIQRRCYREICRINKELNKELGQTDPKIRSRMTDHELSQDIKQQAKDYIKKLESSSENKEKVEHWKKQLQQIEKIELNYEIRKREKRIEKSNKQEEIKREIKHTHKKKEDPDHSKEEI